MAREGRIEEFGATEAIPYTHAVHARRCREAAQLGQVLSSTFVQVKSGPVVYCGRIVAAWDHEDAGEMWKLNVVTPLPGLRSFPVKRARQCSGIDGRCVCEFDATRRAEEPATLARHGASFSPDEKPEGQVTC